MNTHCRVIAVIAMFAAGAAIAEDQPATVKLESVDNDPNKLRVKSPDMDIVTTDLKAAVLLQKAIQDKNAAVADKQAADSAQAKLKSGKLISLGVTAGVALSFVSPLSTGYGGKGSSNTLAADGLAMPYLVLAPAYWALSPAARDFCGSSWAASSENDAFLAAQATADDEAERLLKVLESFEIDIDSPEKLRNRLKQEYTGDLADKVIGEDDPKDKTRAKDDAILRELVKYLALEKTKRQDRRAEIKQMLSSRAWDPTRPAQCGWTKFGFWAGIPGTTTFRSYIDGITGSHDSNRQYKPIVSFGLVFIPNAYVAILTGPVVGNLVVGEDTANKGTNFTAWGWVVGLGGNLDLVSLLTQAAK